MTYMTPLYSPETPQAQTLCKLALKSARQISKSRAQRPNKGVLDRGSADGDGSHASPAVQAVSSLKCPTRLPVRVLKGGSKQEGC